MKKLIFALFIYVPLGCVGTVELDQTNNNTNGTNNGTASGSNNGTTDGSNNRTTPGTSNQTTPPCKSPEAVFEREVNCWPKTQQRSEEQFAALRSSYGLSNPLNPSRFDAENDSATKATSKDRTKAEPDSATSLALRFYHIFLFLFDDIRSQEHCL